MSEATKTIVLVDDDVDFIFQLKVQIEALGHEVLTAGSMDEAKNLLAGTKPDLAILDLMMEETDAGFTLSRDIKIRYPDVPVILCTGVAHETGIDFDAATPEERAWIKADALLAKPIRFEQLQKEINRLLDL